MSLEMTLLSGGILRVHPFMLKVGIIGHALHVMIFGERGAVLCRICHAA